MSLKEKYQKEVVPEMMRIFNLDNPFSVPRIEKVVLNVGFGKIIGDKGSEEQKKIVDSILQDLALISGQKPIPTVARKSISGFKVKKGQVLGAKVTLRGSRMYQFLERLIHIALPRSRDFKGIPKEAFDKNGNLTIGIKEHVCFPEISLEKTRVIFGLEVCIHTNSGNREMGIALLRLLGLPIKNN